MIDSDGNVTEVIDLGEFMRSMKHLVDAELAKILQQVPRWTQDEITPEIMAHAVFSGGGGKRLRPALALLVGHCLGAPIEGVLHAATAIELIHSYTLILDDIQDGDETRRGEPTAHVKYGINLSLLAAGRLLLEGVGRLQEISPLPPSQLRKILHKLHAGQEADIESERLPPAERNISTLEFIFLGKTGALFELSCLVGLYGHDPHPSTAEQIAAIGNEIGIIFQAVDDLLEVIGREDLTGKPVGKDRADKLTFLKLFSDVATAKRTISERHAVLERKIRQVLGPQKATMLTQFLTRLVDRVR